jgi:hypothetical protein
MPNPTTYNGRGSVLAAYVASAYVAVAQLTRFEPAGSKQTFVDQTSVTTPGVFTVPKAVQVDSGDFELEGVCNPHDSMELNLLSWHASLDLVAWQATLTDGSVYSFSAYVSECVPFQVRINKCLRFSAKLRIAGGMQSPAGVFDPAVFSQAVFATGSV